MSDTLNFYTELTNTNTNTNTIRQRIKLGGQSD